MSDEIASTNGDGDQGGQSGTYTPPATQADLDRIIAGRISREREKFSDYDAIKAKADAHDQSVEAQKTELQKANDRADAAEAKVAAAEQEKQVSKWRKDAADAAGVPEAALRGSTKEELEAHATEIKSLIPADDKKGALAPYVPGEGTGASGTAATTAQAFADWSEQNFQSL